MKMPFGKYGPDYFPPEGADIVFINSNYLRWLLKQDWFIDREDDLVLAVEDELRKRDKSYSHFYEDKVG